MTRPIPTPPARPRRRLVPGAAAAAAVAAVALAFGAGRWSAPSSETSVPPPEPVLMKRTPEPLAVSAPAPAPAPAPIAATAPITAPVPAPSAPHPPGLTPEVANRVNQEAKAQVEAQRERIVSRCWPRGASGRPRASVTYNLTFDAKGREIARGIAEDRRAPASEFAQCLRRLDRTAVAIAPPGTNVGLSFAVSYP
jgi:hypothetical protein